MSETTRAELAEPAGLEPELAAFTHEVAGHCEEFLAALQVIAQEADGEAVSLLLLQVSQVLLTGARLGAQEDFDPAEKYQPDVGEEDDFAEVRLRLATVLGSADTYSFVFDPYAPEVVVSQISDDVTAVATDLENGLRHYRRGDLLEALWWWQFSYVNNWGNLAGAVLNALLTVVAHDRLDADFTGEDDELDAATEMLESTAPPAG